MTEIQKKPLRNVMIFIDWYYPAYKAGGPIKSVYNIVMSLKQKFNFTIVTSDSDIGGEKLIVEKNKLIPKGGVNCIYLSPEKQNAGTYRRLFDEIAPDVVYYNSLFSKKFTLLPYLLYRNRPHVKHVIAPRGMLGDGSLSQKSFKKKVFIGLAKRLLFKPNLVWHATTENEKEEIFNQLGKQRKVHVAKIPLSLIDADRKIIEKKEGSIKLVYLSRIHPIKNLLFLLEVLSEMQMNKELSLDIYGPIEDEPYWSACLEYIDKMDNVWYKGQLTPDQIGKVVQKYHYLVLPTKNENYGHVITEFLCHGVPVLISNKTPWLNLQEEKVGYALDLDASVWRSALQEVLQHDTAHYRKTVDHCKSYASRFIVSEKNIHDNEELFL